MIKNVLLPEAIGTYYLFAKRIVGFEITQRHVFATVVYLRGTKRTIEKSIAMQIEQDNGQEHMARTANTIKKVLQRVGKYDQIYTALSAAHIVTKSLRLPFNETGKIQKVIDYEVEPLLPFSIQDAIVDFIITKDLPEQKSSEVLVAAVQKQYIDQQIELFAQAGVQPQVITIDLFELYGFFRMIPQYQSLDAHVLLIEINDEATNISLITDQQLRFIRTLPMGTATVARELATELSASYRDAYNQITQHGFNNGDEAYKKALSDACKSFAQRIQFTLQSFATQTELTSQNTRALLLGNGATIDGICDWLHRTLDIRCDLFTPQEIQQNETVNVKNAIPVANTVSAAVALPNPITEHVNMRKKEFAPSQKALLLKQLIMGGTLTLLLFISLFTFTYMQIRTLRNELKASRQETSDMLLEWFPEIDQGPIDDMLDQAKEEIEEEERIWFSFARSANNSLLRLLLELTRLDREGLGLIIEKITIDQDRGIMQLKAQVKEYEALVRLENELRASDLFTYVEPQDNPNFNMELHFGSEPQGEE